MAELSVLWGKANPSIYWVVFLSSSLVSLLNRMIPNKEMLEKLLQHFSSHLNINSFSPPMLPFTGSFLHAQRVCYFFNLKSSLFKLHFNLQLLLYFSLSLYNIRVMYIHSPGLLSSHDLLNLFNKAFTSVPPLKLLLSRSPIISTLLSPEVSSQSSSYLTH